MDKRTKILILTNILCLIFSLISLYGFIFVIEVSKGWRLFLVVLAIGWIVSAISNLVGVCDTKDK